MQIQSALSHRLHKKNLLACQIVGLSQLLKGRASRQVPASEGELKTAATSRESRSDEASAADHVTTQGHDDPDAAALADQLERVKLTDRPPKDATAAADLRPESVTQEDGSAPGLQLLIVLDSSAIVHMLSTDLELAQAADLGDAHSKRACDALFSFRNLQRLDVRWGMRGIPPLQLHGLLPFFFSFFAHCLFSSLFIAGIPTYLYFGASAYCRR